MTKALPKIKTISFTAKCSDLFSAAAKDASGQFAGEYTGYVPPWLDKDGDYIELTIDVETGQILNWKKPSQKALRETFQGAKK
jgi:hypothetical protein